MTPKNLWRAIAVTAITGWAITGLGWATTARLSTPGTTGVPAASAPGPTGNNTASHSVRTPRFEPLVSRGSRRMHPQGSEAAPSLKELKQAARRQALAELDVERAERRLERSESHMNHLLDEVASFAEANDLSPKQHAALDVSMEAMHERMEAFRPEGPPGPGGPPEDTLQQMKASLAQLNADAVEALDNPDLADEFTEMMTPPPLRRQRDAMAQHD